MKSLCFALCLFVFGCSSAVRLDNREITPDVVLSTMDGTSQPSWASEGKPWYQDGPNVYSVGVTTIHGNERVEAAMRVAALNSRVAFAQTVNDKLSAYLQSAEENFSLDSTQVKSLASSASELTAHSIKTESYWYKRYVSTQEDGKHIYYKVYALSSMPVTDLRQAMDQAISGKINEHKLSDDFKTKADAQFSKILGLETQTAAK